MWIKFLLKLLTSNAVQQIARAGIERAVEASETTIDDKFLSAWDKGLTGKDYGLQRKPTGKRPNRRNTGSGKKA